MKRFMLALALIASLQVASAQVKSESAARKAVEKAVAASQDEKKATKLATWMNLGKAYVDAYDAPKGNAWIGANRQELTLILGDDKPLSSEQTEVGGQSMTVDKFASRNYYYNVNGILQMIVVTKPLYPDALEKAADAYATAWSLDEKGKKKKDISAALQKIDASFVDEAYNAYSFGDVEKACYYFMKAADVSCQAPSAAVDTSAVYNAGLTAAMLAQGDSTKLELAKEYLQKSVDLGYYGEDGEAYAKLAEIADREGNQALRQQYLETAFIKYPQSQAILVGLINYYLTTGGNTDRLFELINAAKQNEPTNASLYYVEGNIYLQLGNEEKAVEAYRKCAEINPEYEFGFIGEGQFWYNKAIDLQEKASAEMDNSKYEALMGEFNVALKNCIEPFEQAFNTTKDEGIKRAVCEYLKQACYRFSYDEPLYKEKYDFYSAYLNGEAK